MAEYIINIVLSVLVGLIFVIIGIRQCKSKTPVVMNTGEKPLKPEQLRDVGAWNKMHGKACIMFGIAVAFTEAVFPIVINYMDAVFSSVLFIMMFALEIMGLIANHERLERLYRIK